MNLVNEAALFAARGNKRLVTMEEFERAKDKIMMGAERRSMVMSDQERLNTAYHEAGHAIVGMSLPEHDPVYKVTIIPRGRALGVTMFLPEEDRYSYSKRRLEGQITSLFGGRIAEELRFGPDAVTTGASNDIERATNLARNMVTKWGLSDRLGPLSYMEDAGEVFLGRQVTQHKQVSDVTAHVIDEEIRRVIDTAYGNAREHPRRQPREARPDGRGAHQVLRPSTKSSSRTSWRDACRSHRATGTRQGRKPAVRAARSLNP